MKSSVTHLRTLPDWGLGMLTGFAVIFTVTDLCIPDPIPLLDEATLLALDYKIWREWWQRRAEALKRLNP